MIRVSPLLATTVLMLAGFAGPAGAADVPPGEAARSVFTCAIRRGSVSVTVSERGGSLTLRLRMPGKQDTAVTGDAAHRTVLSFQGRYAGMERQLRFIDGRRSYIVYTMDGNQRTGAQAVSGLSILLDRTLTSDQPCARYAEVTEVWSGLSLPEDTEEYSAMQLPP